MGRGLSPLQKEILAILGKQGLMRVKTLFDHFVKPGAVNRKAVTPTISRAVSRLVDRGLVERGFVEIRPRKIPAVRLSATTKVPIEREK
jgi:hypothetical protein